MNVWITGASSGIGEALAKQFAKRGDNLILTARREDELNRVAKDCQNGNNQILVLPADLTILDNHSSLVDKIIKDFGSIDILVLNAGVSQRSRVIDTDFKVYRNLFEINFFSLVSMVQAVLPIFRKQGYGHFVPIASVAGRISTPRRAAYGATKHAVFGFFDALRAEEHDFGIQVTTILPGYIKTNISIAAMNEKGENYGKMDPNQAKGIDVDYTAKKIMQAILAKKNEYFIGGKLEAFGLFVKRFFPSLGFYLIRRIKNT
ncbi:MAG: hypothetical protein RIR51_779 [Bacteroidota bacterium]|jgi:short-subunit dehydrogenase